jgi:hypothetical protein
MLSEFKWKYSAHPALQSLLDKIDARFGNRLVVLGSSPEWLTFRVSGLTELNVIRQLEREQAELFGPELWSYQILYSQAGEEPGVSIRILSTSGERSAIRSGFWSY